MDQIINHASKFYHMYNRQINCPVVIRSPMGGRRGYGPTHSQTLDKFLIGIDNIKVIAINKLIDPAILYEGVAREKHPCIVLENKTDYTRTLDGRNIENFDYFQSIERFPIIKISPKNSVPNMTIVGYGGMVHHIENIILDLFINQEILCEVLVYSQLHPVEIEPLLNCIKKTRNLVTIEEGSSFSGWGSEILAQVVESGINCKSKRISSYPVPIPSVKSLEQIVLPDEKRIIEEIKETFNA